jgi:hypothetical protein
MFFFKDRFKNIENPEATIGLDISSRMIKWVNLGRDYELKRYAIQAIPMSKGKVATKNASYIANNLKNTLFGQDSIRNCIINIPDVLVCSKWVQVDCTNDRHILKIIELLVEQSFPYPLSKLYYDYQFYQSLNQEKSKVLIVACRREDLDFRLDIVQQANLIPRVVEVSSYALERAYSFFFPDSFENTLLIDIGINQLTFLFLNSSQTLVYCENLLTKCDQESILLQIKRCIKRYVLTYPFRFLKQLFIISFNSSVLNFLLHRLDGFLQLKIKTLKNQNCLKYSTEINSNKIKQKFLNLFLSYGLALRINLYNNKKIN